jgi:AbrB family looped-hinge helix DNA binding protein
MKVYKVTEKGQVTLPAEVRETLGIDHESYVRIWTQDEEIRMRKVDEVEPLGPEDPIWELVGSAASGRDDVSERHDEILAEGEVERWRESSRTRARSTRSSTAATGTTRKRSVS